MRLKRRWSYGKTRDFSIQDAVESECQGSDSDDTISRLKYNVDSTAEVIGRLIQTLHGSGRLSDAEVLEIVRSGFEKAE